MASIESATLIAVSVLHAADTTTNATTTNDTNEATDDNKRTNINNDGNEATDDNKRTNINNDGNGNVACYDNACMEDEYYDDNLDEDDDFYYPNGDFRKFCLAQQQQSSFVIDLSLLHGSDFANDATINDEQAKTSKRSLQLIISSSPQHDMD
jgi:hypothetical protein